MRMKSSQILGTTFVQCNLHDVTRTDIALTGVKQIMSLGAQYERFVFTFDFEDPSGIPLFPLGSLGSLHCKKNNNFNNKNMLGDEK